MVKRIDDTDAVVLGRVGNDEPFRLGHEMKVLEIDSEDDHYGIIVKVREGRRTAYLPILDLEAIDEMNQRYMDQYSEWFCSLR